jgi:tight adherence protein B
MALLIALIFICVMIAIISMGAAFSSGSSRAQVLRERLKSEETALQQGTGRGAELLRDELLSGIPALNKILTRWSRTSRLQLLLEQSDLKLRAGKFLLLCACSGAAVGCVVLAFTSSLALTVPSLFLGALLPLGYAVILRRKRFHKFEAMFPQAIDLLVRSSRAGHPFTTSLEMIANELSEPISGEFRRVYEEQKFGLPIREALLNFAQRVPLVDVKFFVTSLLLQRETGGNLAEILDKLSYVIRERFRIVRQVRVYTAQGRLTMMLLMAIPPGMVVFMSITNPDFMKPLFHDPMGHFFIVLGITLQTIGFFLIRRIIEIKV